VCIQPSPAAQRSAATVDKHTCRAASKRASPHTTKHTHLHYEVHAVPVCALPLHHQELVAQVLEAVGALAAPQRVADVHTVAHSGQPRREAHHIELLLLRLDAALIGTHVPQKLQ
jgi:hypothetical protein